MSAQKANGEELVITRKIQAPRQLVWDAFTKPEHLKHWWGPAGTEAIVHKMDLRQGGSFFYEMKPKEGNSMYGLFNYREINEPEKIVFTNSFADEGGNITRAPFFDGKWPLEVLNTWTFEEENGYTILTLKGYPVNPTEEEAKLFKETKPSMNQGFGGTFDQLDVYLKQLS